jgi:hypothetical protein
VHRRRRANPWPIVLALVVVIAIGAAVFFAIHGTAFHSTSRSSHTGGSSAGGAVPKLHATTAYDPLGDGVEHNDAAHLATDGSAATYWETEHYNDAPSLGKPGVGLVLDAGRDVQLHQLGIATSTPGFTAEIKGGDSPTHFTKVIGPSQTVGARTTFQIESGEYRYYLIWITRLGQGYNTARINEVDAS